MINCDCKKRKRETKSTFDGVLREDEETEILRESRPHDELRRRRRRQRRRTTTTTTSKDDDDDVVRGESEERVKGEDK